MYGAPPPTGVDVKERLVPAQTVSFGVTAAVLVSGDPAVNVTVPVAAQTLLLTVTV